jgi:uncharacterized protein
VEAQVAPVKTNWRRRLFRAAIALTLLAIAVLAKGYWNATRDPVIRTADVSVADWPKASPPIKVLLISDIHVAGPDMPPERVERLVRQLNALKPDLILIAGDLVSEKGVATHIYSAAEATAPLAGLRAPLGVIAVLGNHDHWFRSAPLEAGLMRGGITVLKNEAIERGPLVIGGVSDAFLGFDDVPATFGEMDKLGGKPRILLSHGPDIVPDMPSPVAAVFTGHTHCGQIAFPYFGALTYVSRYGDRFACGDITDRGQRIFVTAGLGTSVLPLRYGAMPDAWLVTLKP